MLTRQTDSGCRYELRSKLRCPAVALLCHIFIHCFSTGLSKQVETRIHRETLDLYLVSGAGSDILPVVSGHGSDMP